ncbi:hypothetical protein [Mesorhizobium wenxiniae]|nr:hypothetical protein [Mesorhizobium wenxiniae]
METFEQILARGVEALGFEKALNCFYYPAISSNSLEEFLKNGAEEINEAIELKRIYAEAGID